MKKRQDFLTRVKRFDIFGRKLYLTHAGKESHRTKIGCCLTIFFLVVYFSYGLSLCLEVWSHKIRSITNKKFFHNPNE